MAWISAGGSAENKSENANSSAYGNRTPIISPQYSNTYDSYAKSLGFDPSQWSQSASTPTYNPATGQMVSTPAKSSYAGPPVQSDPYLGANSVQRGAIDWQQNNLASGKIDNAVADANGLMSWTGKHLNYINDGPLAGIAGQAAPQMAGAQSAGTFMIDPKTGASMSDPYKALYGQELIDPSLKAYDYGTDRAFSALDARTAGAGAFGNTRSGLGYSDLGAQSAMGRGQLESGLKTTALTNAFGLGQTDANRKLSADTTNAGNLLSTNNLNANLLQDTQKTNLGATQTNTSQQLQATTQMADNLRAGAGLSQQIMDNIVKGNEIDTNAAQNLFQAGTITQAQLQTILDAAQSFNGSAYTDNKNASSNSTTVSAKVGIGV